MTNPESFVIEQINRLETDWHAQDEWIEESFKHGKLTGEYYGQTGAETPGARGSDTAGAIVYLSSVLSNIHIHGVLGGDNGLDMTATLAFSSDCGEIIIPPIWPFDADGNINTEGFVDIGYMSDDGVTMRPDLGLSEGLFQQQDDRFAHLDLGDGGDGR